MPNYIVEKAKQHIIKLENKGTISKKNKQLIIDFIDKLQAEGHSKGDYSDNRLKKYIYGLSTMTKLLGKDWDKATQIDINKLAATIRNDYKGETPRDYLVMLRIFMRYIKELDGDEFEENEFPDIVKKIKPGSRKYPKISVSKLLTIDDVNKLANLTQNSRDRCFVLMLYETGCRIGELIGDEKYKGIRIGDIKQDKYGAIVTVDGKTGIRHLRLIASAPAIALWKKEHPDKENPNAPLFCSIWTNRGGKVKYRYWYDLLKGNNYKKKENLGDRGKGLGEKAGINKPMNPHWFRHSRASELAKYMTESQLNYYMGWEQGSKQAKTYVQLSGRDTEGTILAMYGIKDEEKEESKFKPIVCPRCGITNDPASKFCSGCSLGLDEKSIIEYDKQQEEATDIGMILKKAKDDDSIKEMIKPLIKELLLDEFKKEK
jgi:integrase